MAGFTQSARLKRRLRSWHIFFIALGGVIGIGFFQGASKTLAVSGPGGALMATIVVGIVAVMVMEAICELICIWPIPNAMVEFVRAFVDEDLGVAIGILYWYTYCVTFSVIVTTAGELTDYWGESYLRKTAIFIIAPLCLMGVNAAPVAVFGWVEFFGGIVKLCIVVGLVILMALINFGGTLLHDGGYISADLLQSAGRALSSRSSSSNSNVASSKFAAVSACMPPAIFAYIGVELLTTTAFEARSPRDMRLPARSIGPFALVIYGLVTGTFVANVSWEDRNLPQLFRQSLTTVTRPLPDFFLEDINSHVHAAPLIVLLRLGFKFLPGFINGCLIYSASSCANTALYVASRQLYGLTRTMTVTPRSNFVRRFLGWMGRVDFRTKSPWPALFISVLFFYWLPFIKRDQNYKAMQDIQNVLAAAGSVSCVLVWCSQCVAYAFFYHWREKHIDELRSWRRYNSILDPHNTGLLSVGQPYLSYLGAIATLLIVFFFNTASLWNGNLLTLKAISAFASPAVLVIVYLVKKFTRPKSQWKFWNDLSRWSDFEERIQHLNDLVFPDEKDDRFEHEESLDTNEASRLKSVQMATVERHSTSDVSSAEDRLVGHNHHRSSRHDDYYNNASVHLNPSNRPPSWSRGDLRITTQLAQINHTVPTLLTNDPNLDTNMDRSRSVSPYVPDEIQPAPQQPVGHGYNPHSPPDTFNNVGTTSPNATNRYYEGRNALSPQDAVTYPQQQQQNQGYWSPTISNYSRPSIQPRIWSAHTNSYVTQRANEEVHMLGDDGSGRRHELA